MTMQGYKYIRATRLGEGVRAMRGYKYVAAIRLGNEATCESR
jgi:hypothetical protein